MTQQLICPVLKLIISMVETSYSPSKLTQLILIVLRIHRYHSQTHYQEANNGYLFKVLQMLYIVLQYVNGSALFHWGCL